VFAYHVRDFSSEVKPSPQDEIEIAYVNPRNLEMDELYVVVVDRRYAWLTTGPCDSLLETGSFIPIIRKRQALIVASPEEIVFSRNCIEAVCIHRIAAPLETPSCGEYGLGLI
jgi:glucose-1-phosphate thymidylyltransferase